MGRVEKGYKVQYLPPCWAGKLAYRFGQGYCDIIGSINTMGFVKAPSEIGMPSSRCSFDVGRHKEYRHAPKYSTNIGARRLRYGYGFHARRRRFTCAPYGNWISPSGTALSLKIVASGPVGINRLRLTSYIPATTRYVPGGKLGGSWIRCVSA